VTQKRHRELVRDGIANRPWDNLEDQIYLSSEEFIVGCCLNDRETLRPPA
jgi:hypothetical protein